jgi:hypothetical protein
LSEVVRVDLFVFADNATGCRVWSRDQADRRDEQDWPRLLSGVIPTLPDSAVDGYLADTKGEETGQVFIMIAAATLIDGVAGVTSWSGEIECYRVALYNCFAAGLAHRVAVGGGFYLQVR